MIFYKPHPILTGVLSLKSTLTYAFVLLFISIIISIILVFENRMYSPLILVSALVPKLGYNMQPIRLKEKGLHGVLVFLA